MSNPSFAVADLQSKWHTLHDLDRACAVHAIHQAGTSLRELAKALNCSDSLLRHLLAALQATPADRLLLRQRKISTNELVRRSEAAGIRRTAMLREAQEFECIQAEGANEWDESFSLRSPKPVQSSQGKRDAAVPARCNWLQHRSHVNVPGRRDCFCFLHFRTTGRSARRGIPNPRSRPGRGAGK